MPYRGQLDCDECPCVTDAGVSAETWTDWSDDAAADRDHQARWCRICGRGQMRRVGATSPFGVWAMVRT